MSHLFSVVTSVYNGEKFIKKAIDSVLNQTERDFEYILVDNGSYDDTTNILNSISNLADFDIKIIRVEKNLGISGGRNLGISHATGKYICFLDADDYWDSYKLEIVKKNIDIYSNYDIFCHWENHIKSGKKYLGKYRTLSDKNQYVDLLLNGNVLSTSAVVVKSNLLNKVKGFDNNLVSGEEDYDLWLRLIRAGGKLCMIKSPLGYWLIRDDSVSSKIVEHTMAVSKMLDLHYDDLQDYKFSRKKIEKLKNKKDSFYYFVCGRSLSKNKEYRYGNEFYKKALQKNKLNFKVYIGFLLNIIKK